MTNYTDNANEDDANNDDSSGVSGGNFNASVSWTLGARTYNAGQVTGVREEDTFGIISIDNGLNFQSGISITYTLTGPGSYYISGSPDSVADDSEENQFNPKRIAILVQEIDPSSSIGVSLYQTIPDSGFIDVSVDSVGKYHFDIPSSSPISLGSLILDDLMNTIDFSLINVYDYQ